MYLKICSSGTTDHNPCKYYVVMMSYLLISGVCVHILVKIKSKVAIYLPVGYVVWEGFKRHINHFCCNFIQVK